MELFFWLALPCFAAQTGCNLLPKPDALDSLDSALNWARTGPTAKSKTRRNHQLGNQGIAYIPPSFYYLKRPRGLQETLKIRPRKQKPVPATRTAQKPRILPARPVGRRTKLKDVEYIDTTQMPECVEVFRTPTGIRTNGEKKLPAPRKRRGGAKTSPLLDPDEGTAQIQPDTFMSIRTHTQVQSNRPDLEVIDAEHETNKHSSKPKIRKPEKVSEPELSRENHADPALQEKKTAVLEEPPALHHAAYSLFVPRSSRQRSKKPDEDLHTVLHRRKMARAPSSSSSESDLDSWDWPS